MADSLLLEGLGEGLLGACCSLGLAVEQFLWKPGWELNYGFSMRQVKVSDPLTGVLARLD